MLRVGVLALQGDFREHITSLTSLNVAVQKVRNPEELKTVNALVIPGGESTTISMLTKRVGLLEPLRKFVKDGFAVYGSCAGMILLSDNVKDAIEGQETFGGIDMVVRRNAFGRQVDSFETDLKFKGITDPAIRAVFIRAPWVESVGSSVEVLAEVIDESGTKHPVAVRSGNLLATSFHPELTGDNRVHKFFVENICRQLASSKG